MTQNFLEFIILEIQHIEHIAYTKKRNFKTSLISSMNNE